MGSFKGHITDLSDDDKVLLSHIKDVVRICEKTHRARFSAFLDERQIMIAGSAMSELGFSGYEFFGGYDGASRKVLGVFPEYYDVKEKFPISALAFKFRDTDKLSHRDFLGSFMSRQIERDMIGDIIVSEGSAVAFVYDTVKQMLLYETDKIGSVGVKVSEDEKPEINAEQSFIEKNCTVSSMRLDCIVSAASGVSRGKAADLIKGGSVSVMYAAAGSPSVTLSEGDIFSVRGFGKYLLYSVNGTTKKGRLHITLKKYN